MYEIQVKSSYFYRFNAIFKFLTTMMKLQVIGNLGKDCITNQVSGRNVINFSVAHTERYRDSAGVQKERTTWVECAYWTDRTGIAPYLKRGTQVFVEGTPEVRTYNRNDGTVGHSLTMRVNYVQLLGQREGGPQENPNGNGNGNGNSYNNNYNNNAPRQAAPPPAAPMPQDGPDDLPF